MRQSHRAGECAFVDFAGATIPWTDLKTGKELHACLFTGVLGCSNYAFLWALPSQSTEDFCEAHEKMFRFFSGVPQVVTPDNLKAAVTRPGEEPEINRVYRDLARHYRFVIVPARVRKPRDKAKSKWRCSSFSAGLSRRCVTGNSSASRTSTLRSRNF